MRVFVFLCVSECPWLSLSPAPIVPTGMSPFPRDGSDLTTAKPTPRAGNPSH